MLGSFHFPDPIPNNIRISACSVHGDNFIPMARTALFCWAETKLLAGCSLNMIQRETACYYVRYVLRARARKCMPLNRCSIPCAFSKTSNSLFIALEHPLLRYRRRYYRSGLCPLSQWRRFRHSLHHPLLSCHVLLVGGSGYTGALGSRGRRWSR